MCVPTCTPHKLFIYTKQKSMHQYTQISKWSRNRHEQRNSLEIIVVVVVCLIKFHIGYLLRQLLLLLLLLLLFFLSIYNSHMLHSTLRTLTPFVHSLAHSLIRFALSRLIAVYLVTFYVAVVVAVDAVILHWHFAVDLSKDYLLYQLSWAELNGVESVWVWEFSWLAVSFGARGSSMYHHQCYNSRRVQCTQMNRM